MDKPAPTTEDQVETELSVRLLGSGGPWVDAHRFGPSTLIRFGDERLLFDTGRGVGIRMVQAGEEPGDLDTVFITHHHLDHISDLADVMITSWLRGRRREMTIYGPPGTKAIVDALLNLVYAKDIEWRSVGEPTWGGWQPVRAVDVEPGVVVANDRWTVSCDYVVHGHKLGFRKEFVKNWKCLGYRFEDAGGRAIVVSGDTIDCGGIRRLAKDADVLVQCCFANRGECEGNPHLDRVAEFTLADTRQAATIAQECNVRHLVVTHIRPKSRERMAEMRREIRQVFRRKLTVGRDMALVRL
ncbi:MAG: MBL fold metallo-hydrolase [Hyphomicrobiales bacterium]|nr:MBL fold metallo-hydrolase [Hyphomicrobiales bacterium]